ncbi:copper homeostasis membrane protein CopD [Novosphingobium olei]|uniref:Copper homeostasis membrane protein CopD n=1 Tax=Novosphingobium olei TaxID=2728851 RepID=A0A7Y0GAZ3_9SPHN|nr:copper homeostasis membrane protein CopD [Novosphingobium olei]NML95751.1 copper homeostasis membrane protein CopD [Novosphingobium olei]
MNGFTLVRWAVYADLGLLFGVPAAAILLGARQTLEFAHRSLLALAIISVPLAAMAFFLLVAQMAGTAISGLDPQLILDLLTGSTLGLSAIARSIALFAALVLLARPRSNPRWLVLPTSIATGSLAWSGHAAASEGWMSALRLALDITHLLAASIWIGALALFLAMLFHKSDSAGEPVITLSRFAGIGSGLVGTLFVTGLANLTFLVSPMEFPSLTGILYGRLLLLKLCAFWGMLALAAVNRFVFVPKLIRAGDIADRAALMRKLKLSIVMETVLAFTVLILVAQLGLADPSLS